MVFDPVTACELSAPAWALSIRIGRLGAAFLSRSPSDEGAIVHAQRATLSSSRIRPALQAPLDGRLGAAFRAREASARLESFHLVRDPR